MDYPIILGMGRGAMGLHKIRAAQKTPLKQSLRELEGAQKGGVTYPPLHP